jgi:simple sugar transport system permease protein/ribose transport system permease protein
MYTRWGAYIACAFFAGLAAILEASNLGYVDGSFGRQRELQAIAAAVLGGCALTGGRSSIIGTFLGAFILSGVQSYLVIKSIQPQSFILLLGMIVVLVSLAERALTQFLTRLAKQKTPD